MSSSSGSARRSDRNTSWRPVRCRRAFPPSSSKANTVTVVHLIYKSKNYESSSKDYDFSHVGMVEHWSAGVRDVHLSMRHKEWLERPQSDETMVTYDLTRDGSETLDGKQE